MVVSALPPLSCFSVSGLYGRTGIFPSTVHILTTYPLARQIYYLDAKKTDSIDSTMYITTLWMLVALAQSGRLWVAGGRTRYVDPIPEETAIISEVVEKRGNVIEPTCEELRAMWRYSKRQSRTAEATNELPMYRDPFSYNIWEIYPDRPRVSLGYRDDYSEQPRNRGAGGAPIYGRMVHKAPAGSRLRNGAPDRSRLFEEMTRYYGTINRYPPSSLRQTSFRHGGGAAQSISQVPQAGSFQYLKDIIRAEHARELQEQRREEEMAARADAIKAVANGKRRQDAEDSGRHFLNELQAYQDPRSINYDFSHVHYMSGVSDIGEALSRGNQYAREYMLR